MYCAPMSVPVTLLGLLERESSHGYDLKRDYDTYFGWGRSLPFGQVYATLSRLARDGKVSAGQVEPGAGPDRKRYAITELRRSAGPLDALLADHALFHLEADLRWIDLTEARLAAIAAAIDHHEEVRP